MVIPFVHVADVHLGRLQAGGLSAAQLAQRRLDALRALQQCLDHVRLEKVPLLFIAGDLFEHETAAKPLIQEVADLLAGLSETRVFIAAGNHDYAAGDSFYRTLSWPDNVHLFLGDWERVVVGELGLTVHGRGFTGPECDTSVLSGYSVREPGDDGLHVLLMHADYLTSPGAKSSYLPLYRAELEACGADYVALGHAHRPQVLMEVEGRAVVAYSGALEPLNFSEEGPHGYFTGSLEQGGANLSFVPAAVRQYRQVRVDVTGLDTMPKIMDVAGEQLAALPKDDLVRLVLYGELQSGMQSDCSRLQELGEGFFAFEVLDQTVSSYDLETLSQGYSARAVFVRRLMAYLDTGSEEEQALVRQALQMGLDALAGREVRVS